MSDENMKGRERIWEYIHDKIEPKFNRIFPTKLSMEEKYPELTKFKTFEGLKYLEKLKAREDEKAEYFTP